ncbi:MAG: MBL fold metallo-hydrolase [Clostridia bacterium]|nr:MBL fold metallo-hydrolase [Clostridia bacterium]
MRITFLGTAHGIPERDRRCSSTLIEIGDSLYLVDMGCMAVEDLRRMEKAVESVRAVFLTHMHGDHVNGLPAFADLCSWYFTSADPAILLPAEKGCEALRTWLSCLDTGMRDLDIRSYESAVPGVIYDDGTLRVTAFKTLHTATSHALLVEAEGKRILFTGDLKHPSEDYPSEVFGTRLDLAVCETAHFTPDAYLPVWEKSDVRTAVLQLVQPRKEPLARQLADEKKDAPRVLVGTDGLTLEL